MSLLCHLARPAARVRPAVNLGQACLNGRQLGVRQFWGRAGSGSLRALAATGNASVSREQRVRWMSDDKDDKVKKQRYVDLYLC